MPSPSPQLKPHGPRIHVSRASQFPYKFAPLLGPSPLLKPCGNTRTCTHPLLWKPAQAFRRRLTHSHKHKTYLKASQKRTGRGGQRKACTIFWDFQGTFTSNIFLHRLSRLCCMICICSVAWTPEFSKSFTDLHSQMLAAASILPSDLSACKRCCRARRRPSMFSLAAKALHIFRYTGRHASHGSTLKSKYLSLPCL